MDRCSLADLLPEPRFRTDFVQSPSSGEERGDWREIPIEAVTSDSRAVEPGSLFVAIRGAKFDGHRYLTDALRAGAAAAVVEPGAALPADLPAGAVVLRAENTREVLSHAASAIYGHPSSRMPCIAVTGTNGKTSVSWILAQSLARLSGPSALLGTLGSAVLTADPQADAFTGTDTTTPDPLSIHRELATARQAGVKSAVLEATSQGIAQYRTSDVQWDAAVFTNLTRDHLDLHGSLEAYAALKAELFTRELERSSKKIKHAVLNADDEVGRSILDTLRRAHPGIRPLSFSAAGSEADARVLSAESDFFRSRIRCVVAGRELELQSRLVGRYNVANLLAAVLTLHALGADMDELTAVLPDVPPVPGRLELVAESEIGVFVDYSHTPDALINAQESLRLLGSKRLITVFGCGGDRDRGKRPLMGEAVARLSDYAVVTSDNPRTEAPEAIIDDIIPGLEGGAGRPGFSWERIADRREAIARAVAVARPGDIVLVAGKGHEDYQEIMGTKHPFLDREVCLGAMRANGIVV